MKTMYELLAISKQAHLAFQKRRQEEEDQFLVLIPLLDQYREAHPCMSLKKLYHKIHPPVLGRNKFIDFGMVYGYEAVRYAKVPKTTIPVCKTSYPNLLSNALILGPDQVWVSDITYFKLLGKFYYLVFIMDLYTRRIIGHHASERLFAQANIQALNRALATRGITRFNHQLIHHSDKGSQYTSDLYTNALHEAQIRISIGKIVYDNIHMERTHQTIKGEYLIHRNIKQPPDLPKHLDEVINLYNEERPHAALNMMTPCEYERHLLTVPLFQRTPLQVFALVSKSFQRKPKPFDPNQLFLPFEGFIS